jgi:hypothetical protein
MLLVPVVLAAACHVLFPYRAGRDDRGPGTQDGATEGDLRGRDTAMVELTRPQDRAVKAELARDATKVGDGAAKVDKKVGDGAAKVDKKVGDGATKVDGKKSDLAQPDVKAQQDGASCTGWAAGGWTCTSPYPTFCTATCGSFVIICSSVICNCVVNGGPPKDCSNASPSPVSCSNCQAAEASHCCQ